MQKDKTKIYTVSEVNSIVKMALEENLPPRLIVSGQISDWKYYNISGHCYFSLKDEGGVLPCVMWASKFTNVKFSPENGMAVLATGHIDVYLPGGKYQLYVDKLEPAGVGALQLAFEQMAKRLRADGLFDEEHKKPIPPYPRRIAILTSESGAAIHDIVDSIWNRWPVVKLFLYPVPVQGEGAAEQIAAALKDVNRRNRQFKFDLLILGRGGGSQEDLWAFNEEVLARAIYNSKIPIISAVGHEIDVTIADFVADARASTPTKAGVIAVPDMQEVLGQISAMESRLDLDIKSNLRFAAQNLRTILADVVFRTPSRIIENAVQRLDEAETGLVDCVRTQLVQIRRKLQFYFEQVIRIEPHRLLGDKARLLHQRVSGLEMAMQKLLAKSKLQLTAAENRLAALNPKSVLNRGYSITTNRRSGRLVNVLADVELGDMIITELAGENLIESEVKSKHNKRDKG